MDRNTSGLRWLFFALAGLLLLLAFRDRLPPLFPAPQIPDDAAFREVVMKADRPILVKFGADWCGPCRMMEKSLDGFEQVSRGSVAVMRINVDQNPQLAAGFRISSIPHTFLIANGEVISEQRGYMDTERIVSWVAKKCGPLEVKTKEIPVSTR